MEAPHMANFIWKGRGEGEEEVDVIYRIYNYIFKEKLRKMLIDLVILEYLKIDIFNEFI